MGNHDVTGAGEVRTEGFDDVWSVVISAGDPPLLWTHYPRVEVLDAHVNIHGHTHGAPPAHSPHINVSVEQLEYAPIRPSRLRTFARALVSREYPPGGTTTEQIAYLEKGTAQ